jgi:hypothetical protein
MGQMQAVALKERMRRGVLVKIDLALQWMVVGMNEVSYLAAVDVVVHLMTRARKDVEDEMCLGDRMLAEAQCLVKVHQA